MTITDLLLIADPGLNYTIALYKSSIAFGNGLALTVSASLPGGQGLTTETVLEEPAQGAFC